MTYEYVCTACGHQWEAEQAISASPLRDCPECQKPTAKRQISGGTGFLLKGGGWYADGYGSKANSAKAASGDDAASSGSGSSNKAAEKPSATKSASAASEKPAPSTKPASSD